MGSNKIQLFQDKATKILKKHRPSIVFTSIKEKSYVTKIINEYVPYKGIIVRRNAIRLLQYKDFHKDILLNRYIHNNKMIPKIDFTDVNVKYYDLIIFINDKKVSQKIYKSSLTKEKITQIHDKFIKNML